MQTMKNRVKMLSNLDGFPLNMSFVRDDPYIREAISNLRGGNDLLQTVRGVTRSGASLELLKGRIDAYNVDTPVLPDDDLFSEAVSRTFKAFKVNDLRVLSIQEVVLDSEKAKSHPGWTWRNEGKRKGELFEEAKAQARVLSSIMRKGKKVYFPPCMSFVRTQLGTIDNPKVRLVWGYPFEVTLLEARFCQPLLVAFNGSNSPMFIGKTLLQELPMAIDHLFHHKYAYGLDWSGFDSSISPGLIGIAFKVLEQNFRMSESDRVTWRRLIDYFIHTTIVFPDGTRYVKSSGIPSGSYFTQLIGSIINYLVITYCLLRLSEISPKIWVLGDDSAFGLDEYLDPSQIAAIADREFGLKLNLSKSVVSDDPSSFEFLGHRSYGGQVYRPERKLLELALFPEAYVESEMKSAARLLGLLMDSGFNSPLIVNLYQQFRQHGIESMGRADRYVKYVLQRSIPQGKLPDPKTIWAKT